MSIDTEQCNIDACQRMYGLESEKAIISEDGLPAGHTDNTFMHVLNEYRKSGVDGVLTHSGARIVGVQTPIGLESIDGSFNNGESSSKPICEHDGGLAAMEKLVSAQHEILIRSLGACGANVVNMSNSPLVSLDRDTVQKFSLPKPGSYAREVRNWKHQETIRGQVQNSPSTGVSAEEAPRALNSIIGFGAAIIALYANSPFHNGKVTGCDENRLRLWSAYFRQSIHASDLQLASPPSTPIRELSDYFHWVHGSGTTMFPVLRPDVHGNHTSFVPQIATDLHSYLRTPSTAVYSYPDKFTAHIRPSLHDLSVNQFMQFSGARIRYSFLDNHVEPTAYTDALLSGNDKLTDFFTNQTSFIYIEGRDAGANFADSQLYELDLDAAKSCMISPSALQAGIVNNLDAAEKTLEKYSWTQLMSLRDEAVAHGLNAQVGDLKVQLLIDDLLNVAYDGLIPSQRWMMAYPEFVSRTGLNGSKRARDLYDSSDELTERERIRAVLLARKAIVKWA